MDILYTPISCAYTVQYHDIFVSLKHSVTAVHSVIRCLLLGSSCTSSSGSSSGCLSKSALCRCPDLVSVGSCSSLGPASRRNSVGTWPRIGLFCWRPEIHWLRVAWSPWPVIHMAKTGPSSTESKTHRSSIAHSERYFLCFYSPKHCGNWPKTDRSALILTFTDQLLIWQFLTVFHVETLIVPKVAVQIQV